MSKEELIEFRQKVVEQARQLALEGDADPASKLQLLMALIRSGDFSREALNAAYEVVQQLPEATDKLDILLELMYEVDAQLGADEEVVENGGVRQD